MTELVEGMEGAEGMQSAEQVGYNVLVGRTGSSERTWSDKWTVLL